MRYYHYVSFQEVVASGRVSEEELQHAIDSGLIRLIKEHATGKEWLDGRELHQVFGTDYFSHK